MSNTINLLLKKNMQKGLEEDLLRWCRRVAIVCLVITVGSSLILFLLTLNPSLSSLKNQENNVISNLTFNQGKIAKYLLLKDRLLAIHMLLLTRYPMDQTLGTLLAQLPDGVAIESFNIDKKTLSMKVGSTSLLSLNTALTNITSLLQNKKIFKKLTLENVTADAGLQEYTCSIDGELL